MRPGAFLPILSLAVTACGSGPVLRVCADPDNLPFSNEQKRGFENRVAEVIAGEMGARVEYTWWPQRRSFLRNTLNARKCDVVIGMPTAMDSALTTRPYYRSAYAFISRDDRNLDIRSFDDARLHALRIGVQLVGDDGANSPPAHALSRRGIVRNVSGFPVYSDPARIVRAVASGDVDLAIAWGPLAGYYAARQNPPLRVLTAAADAGGPFLPLAFDIAVAVRSGDTDRRDLIDRILDRRRADIDAILARYHVPRVGRVGS